MSNFLKVGVLSILLGTGIGRSALTSGGIISWVLKHKQYLSENTLLEMMYIMIGAYLSYSMAHLPFFQVSGDVAIFFYGIMMSHYNKFNMSIETFKNIGLTLNLLMLLSEMVSFVYIGLSLEDAFIDHYENFSLAFILILVMLVSRAICLAIFGYFHRGDSKYQIYGKEWVACLSSGMIKGPMTYIFANIIVTSSIPCIDRSNYAIYKAV